METMKSMNFRRIFFLGVLIGLGSVSVAQAQFAAYGMVSAERLNAVNCTNPQNVCASANGIVRPYGGTLGAYYDFRSYGPVSLGVDVRGNFLSSNKSAFSDQGGASLIRHYSFLGGARATFRTPFKVLRPYAQIEGGFGSTDATLAPVQPLLKLNYQNYTQVQGFVGLDLALFENFDFRPVELGIGELFGPSTHNIQSIGIGVVFHTSRNK
jgi:hypothetical protein